MKLSTKGRYAVMAMVDLCKSTTGKPMALSDIAERQEISLSYLEQLFGKLRRAGVVKSVRGPGGGYLLARPAQDICISAIIMAVDEPISTTRCSDTEGCRSDKARCVTHDLWEALREHIYLYLSSISIADVVDRNVRGTGLDMGKHQPSDTIAAE